MEYTSNYTGALIDNAITKAVFNNHPYVDLGLPSGRLWAKCNVGGTAESSYGKYFAWASNVGYDASGNTTTHNFDLGLLTPYYIKTESGNDIYSRYINGETLTIGDDMARNNMGGNWRMPTKEDFLELCNYCSAHGSITWTTIGGVNGKKFTSPNGKYIFFPATGYCAGTTRVNNGSLGYYWTSTCYSGNGTGSYAHDLFFNSTTYNIALDSSRKYGYPIRAVL